MNTRTTAATAALATALLLTACSGPRDTATPDASAAPDETATAAAGGFKVGEEVRNGGAVVKISKVHEVDGILMDGGTRSAGAKGKYVALETVVLNDTKAGMDLACSLPIDSSLIDDQGRRYDAIDDLDRIPGNPECDERLQPGSKDWMVLAYRVPKSVNITAWEFSGPGPGSDREPSTIDLDETSAT
ncbi:hypothetical protein ABT063_46775 [Streptomyces sp. NPDC002838]|uniref:hypothetical protein n=1 Tax=Streptomyces sp. NPDC002838 TaxID=3154436 RepID=UPI0033305D0C